MDKYVIPLVNYFNSQGLKTKMSCEGHNKTNMSMFWISFTDSIQEQDIINFQKNILMDMEIFALVVDLLKDYMFVLLLMKNIGVILRRQQKQLMRI